MDTKKKNSLYSFLATAVLTLAVFLTEKACVVGSGFETLCFSFFRDIQESVIFLGTIFIVSLILLFVREETFRSWVKFAKWYIPIAALLILLAAGTFSGGSYGPSYDLDAEGMSILTAALFLLISIAIIAVKSWKLRKKEARM